MLVLTRGLDEAVEISGPCKITIVDIHCGRVRLAFDASPGVVIARSEIAEFEDGKLKPFSRRAKTKD